MSTPTHIAHRRRSQSASSPIPRRQLDDGKWRVSVKRSRPSSIRSPSYKDLGHDQPPEKWDVDQWRKGKRARRGSNTGDSSDDASSYGYGYGSRMGMTGSDPISPTEEPPRLDGFPSSSRLPCTSAAFQFFPQKQPRRHPHRPAGSARARLSREPSPRELLSTASDEARRIQQDALGDLHRSVAESGEGLVRRMRDWERARSRSARSERHVSGSPIAYDAHRRSPRWQTSYYAVPQVAEPVAEQSEDEDDIFIVGEAASIPLPRSPAHKKRALSLGMMDVDLPEMQPHSSPFAGPEGSDRSSSPVDRSSGPSAYSSDDDEGRADMDTDLSSSGLFSTPALSHTYSASTNSSVLSLPCSVKASEGLSAFISASASSATVVPGDGAPPSPPLPGLLPASASRSEKAIAALTLAMANGAAGISDYDALRVTEELATLDASHVGELWS